jgi:predicted ATPase/class 3 adenylate cyclase
VEHTRAAPEGTIALLFTDIEGSTRFAAMLGSRWPEVLSAHHGLVSGAISAEGGYVDGTEGDAFFATFADAPAAARAAVTALRALHGYPWPGEVGRLKVRMGLHVGFVERGRTGYVGLEVHRAARVAAAAHGGQLLLTAAARALIGDVVPVESVGMHRLKDFPAPEPLFCAVVDGRGAAAFPAPRTYELRLTNLPAGPSMLVGREDQLDQVRSVVMDDGERLVTLIGRGGVGKTSLAIVAATALLDNHPGGVWLVKLAAVISAEDVLPAVATTIGAEGAISGSPLDAILGRLRDRGAVLLVLDNFEHVVAAAPALGTMVDELPDLRILITSQAPLRIAVERCVTLDVLGRDAGLALMERVVRRRGAVLSLSETGRAALLEVVDLLDGLPLGLELAAARLGLLSPVQLRDRLRESPDVLTDTRSDRPARHRSLRATVEWTLDLLDHDQRELFVRMGAYAGAAELQDLEAVAGDDGLNVLESLAGLLDVALVRRVESGDGRVRFGLPEALRQMAATTLDSRPGGQRWRRAHAQRQLDLVWAARTLAVPAEVFETAVAADAETSAALDWARAVNEPLAAPLAAARGMLLADTGRCREALSTIEPIISQPSGDAAVDGLALAARAFALTVRDWTQEAVICADQAVSLTSDGDVETRAFMLMVRGLVRTHLRDRPGSVRDTAQATSLAAGLGPAALAGALLYETQARILAGELDQAAAQLAEVRRIGDPVRAKALWHVETLLGDLAVLSGETQAAFAHYARSLEEAQARRDRLQVFHDLLGVAKALALLCRDTEALEVAGMVHAEGLDIGGSAAATTEHIIADNALAAAQQRVGINVATELQSRGRVIPAGRRVTVACERARAQQPA